MTDNILDFEEFADRKLDREEQVDLRAERDALMAFIKRSDAMPISPKWALINYAECVTSASDHYAPSGSNWPGDFWPTESQHKFSFRTPVCPASRSA